MYGMFAVEGHEHFYLDWRRENNFIDYVLTEEDRKYLKDLCCDCPKFATYLLKTWGEYFILRKNDEEFYHKRRIVSKLIKYLSDLPYVHDIQLKPIR